MCDDTTDLAQHCVNISGHLMHHICSISRNRCVVCLIDVHKVTVNCSVIVPHVITQDLILTIKLQSMVYFHRLLISRPNGTEHNFPGEKKLYKVVKAN